MANLFSLKKIWEWAAKKKKEITVSLIISLLGVVPGLVNIKDWLNDKPKFGYYAESIQEGSFTNNVGENKIWIRVQYLMMETSHYSQLFIN